MKKQDKPKPKASAKKASAKKELPKPSVKVKGDKLVYANIEKKFVNVYAKGHVAIEDVKDTLTMKQMEDMLHEMGCNGKVEYSGLTPEQSAANIDSMLQDLNNWHYSNELFSRGQGEKPLTKEEFSKSLSDKYHVTLKIK